MMIGRRVLWAWILPVLACQVGVKGGDEVPLAKGSTVELTAEQQAIALQLSPLGPGPEDPSNPVFLDPAAARLGQSLFYDPRFSADGKVSCATCHDPQLGWTDGRALAEGLRPLRRHAMGLWNVARQRWFFWDGRADSLWAQALQPFESPDEHGTNRLRVLHQIAGDDDYRRAFEEIFGELPALADRARFPLDARPVPTDEGHPHHLAWTGMEAGDRDAVDRAFANLGRAIAAFERRLVSDRAPFDRFVEGLREGRPEKLAALSDSAVRGLALFVGKGNCVVCHDGPMFSDLEFHSNHVRQHPASPDSDTGRYDGAILVRRDPFNAEGKHAEGASSEQRNKVARLITRMELWGQFKTPSLRNVATTAPYMHQGQLATLEEVVRHYSELPPPLFVPDLPERILRPLHLADGEVQDLVSFLHSLTDTDVAPELRGPPSTPWMSQP